MIERYVAILNELQKNPVSRLYKHELGPIAVELLKLEVEEECRKACKEEKKGKK